ncbi:hypothetical protein HRbin21_00894 [bacterium HR21]|nr:hypothetical protein HRbin21_00894 [bacterium HR21]
MAHNSTSGSPQWKFIVLLGGVSLLADVTYEGARSILGPFFGTLGASATVIGTVSGLGELLGYGARLLSGYISDRTRRYWAVAIAGYSINLLAVPLLALTGHWLEAAGLVLAERLGKAIRTPARDVMLSYAATSVGQGWGFGIHEALDQLGALLGPLLVSLMLMAGGQYRLSFALLLLPALSALALLLRARALYPRPQGLESTTQPASTPRLPTMFWLYLLAAALAAAGTVDFPLFAYHFSRSTGIPDAWIPLLYALAMGADALAALVLGRLFDRLGMKLLPLLVIPAALVAPLVLFGGGPGILAGTLLWGANLGAHESVLRAAVAGIVGQSARGLAYGIFGAGFGLGWFLGSAAMGVLYDVSPSLVAVFSVCAHALSLCLFLAIAIRQ